MKGLWNYLKDLQAMHRATREAYLKAGKTYRSRYVAHENGYLNALTEVLSIVENPERERALQEAMDNLVKQGIV